MILFDLKNLKDGPGGIQSDIRTLMLCLLEDGFDDIGGIIFPTEDIAGISTTTRTSQSLLLHKARAGEHFSFEHALNRVGRRFGRKPHLGTVSGRLLRQFIRGNRLPSVELEEMHQAFAPGIFEWKMKPDLEWSDLYLFEKVKYYLANRSWNSINRAAVRSLKSHTKAPTITVPANSKLLLSSPLWVNPAGTGRYYVRWHDAINLLSVGWENAVDAQVFAASAMQAATSGAKFICNSEASRSDLISFFPRAEENSCVVYCPVRPAENVDNELVAAIRRRNDLEGDYMVTVSSASPRKNFEGILEIFQEVLQHRSDIKLVIIGRPFRLDPTLSLFIKDLEEEGRVVQFADLSRRVLSAIISGAKVYLSGSVHEGFGKGLVEAQGLGVPVVAPKTAVFEEIIGDSGMLFDRFNYRTAVQNCLALLSNSELHGKQSALGKRNSSRFDLAQTARALKSALDIEP